MSQCVSHVNHTSNWKPICLSKKKALVYTVYQPLTDGRAFKPNCPGEKLGDSTFERRWPCHEDHPSIRANNLLSRVLTVHHVLKRWLTQGRSGRQVTLLAGTGFLHINGQRCLNPGNLMTHTGKPGGFVAYDISCPQTGLIAWHRNFKVAEAQNLLGKVFPPVYLNPPKTVKIESMDPKVWYGRLQFTATSSS